MQTKNRQHRPRENDATSALRECAERFESFIELSSEGYWEQDENFRFTVITGGTLGRSGIDPKAYLGTTRWDHGTIPVSDGGRWDEHKALLEAHRPFSDFLMKRSDAKGETRYISASGQPVFDERGRFRGYRGITRDITKEKQAEEVLRRSEERFRSLTNLSSDWYWEQDKELRFVGMTHEIMDKTGIAAPGFIGKHRWDLPALNMSEADWAAHRAVVEARLPFQDLELCRLAEDGKMRWVLISGEPIFDVSGAFKGYRGVGKDITARKRAEQMQSLEHAVTRGLADADNLTAALKSVIRVICEALDWECGRYFAYDAGSDALVCAAGWSVPSPQVEAFIAQSREITIARGQGIGGAVLQSGEPLWVADITEDSRAMRTAQRFGLRGTFAFPVASQGEVVGVLAFNSREVREPEERLVQAVRVIGSQVGQLVRRKQAEDRIRESEERFRSLTDLSSDFYWETDAEHRLAQTQYGNVHRPVLPRDLRSGKTRWELPSTRPDAAGWAAHRAALEAHQPFRDFELARIDENGVERHLSISGEPMFDSDGPFKGYRGVGRDITARKRAEQLLRLEHSVNRRIAEADNVSAALRAIIQDVCETEGWECGRYWQVDESAGVLRFGEGWGAASDTIQRFLERSREAVFERGSGMAGSVWYSGKPLWVADVNTDPRNWRAALAREFGIHGAFVLPVTAGGKTIGVLGFSSYKVREPDERMFEATRVIGSQIGQFLVRKHAEAVVRESEERFRSLTNLSSDMYWEQDEQFRFTSFSGMGSQRVNVNTLKYIGKKRWEQNYVNMTADAWAEHIALLEAHRPFRDMELCRVDEQGRKIWISISGEPVFDAAGVFRGYRGVGKDITERKVDEERIQFLANHDALTALPNRAMFTEVLNLAIQNARRYRRHFAVLFIDLDRFKVVNDTLGHEAGDRLLQEMAKRLTRTVRSSDVVARLGGDEFVVLVQEVSEPKQVAAVARKILAALVQPLVMNQQEVRMTASIGICMYPADAQDEQSLMKNADIAMYRAKEDGKNNYKYYSEEINVHSFEKLALETSLRRGLERSEFLLHYQAKLDLRSGVITGVEALLRWKHPDLGMVPPGQFIPLAEETGLIVPLGKWVLGTACAQVVDWQRRGLPPMRMAVNLSARQFADDNLVSDIAAVLRDTGIVPDLLELELTESMVIQNTERAGQVLADIKRLGVRLAIDDFGVGYSSLSHLKRFPIDTLKVDRSFIRDIPMDPEDKAITEAIIAMGKSLSLTVVAEGVETREQQEFLRDHACDEMQGFYFSKPIPPEQFAEFLQEHLRPGRD